MENESSLLLPKLYHTIVLCDTPARFSDRYFAWVVINAAANYPQKAASRPPEIDAMTSIT